MSLLETPCAVQLRACSSTRTQAALQHGPGCIGVKIPCRVGLQLCVTGMHGVAVAAWCRSCFVVSRLYVAQQHMGGGGGGVDCVGGAKTLSTHAAAW